MLSLLEDVQVLRPRRYTPSATQNFPYRPKKHAVFSSCLTGPALHHLGSDRVTKVEAHPNLQRQARSAQPASVYSRHGAVRCSAKIFTPLSGGTALPQLSDMSLRKSPNGNMVTHWSYDFGLDQRHPAFRLWKCGPWADDVPKVSRIRKSKYCFPKFIWREAWSRVTRSCFICQPLPPASDFYQVEKSNRLAEPGVESMVAAVGGMSSWRFESMKGRATTNRSPESPWNCLFG